MEAPFRRGSFRGVGEQVSTHGRKNLAGVNMGGKGEAVVFRVRRMGRMQSVLKKKGKELSPRGGEYLSVLLIWETAVQPDEPPRST